MLRAIGRSGRDYVERHGAWPQAIKTPRITSVRFMSAIGVRRGRPDDVLVCLLILHGKFATLGPPHVGTADNTEYLVFGAITSNLIGMSPSV